MRSTALARDKRVANFLIYGIDEAGRIAFSELLQDCERGHLQTLAHARLREWPAVEIWEGPVCRVRLRRPAE